MVATCVAIYQFWRDRSGVKLVLTTVVSSSDRREDVIDLWEIRIVNHRKRPITVESAGLLLEQGIHLHPMTVDLDGERTTTPLPATLTDGMSVGFFARRDNEDRIRGAWASDVLNRSFECRYPSRNPIERMRTWRYRRRIDKWIKERRSSR